MQIYFIVMMLVIIIKKSCKYRFIKARVGARKGVAGGDTSPLINSNKKVPQKCGT
jgi:hypothetical protein